MKRLILLFTIIVITLDSSYCQSTFSANRPGQIINPDIVPKGNLMIEAGFQYGKNLGSKNFLLPLTSLRYGLNGNVEISLNASNIYEVDKSLFGLTSYNIGSKIAICEENGARPKISFITAYILPFIGLDSLRPENSGGMIQLALSHSLGNNCTIYGNLGATWNGNDPFPVYNYVLSIYYSPVKKFWIFGELYGLIPEHGPRNMASDLGLSYQAAENFQVDLSFGGDWADPGNNHFIQLGAAFQIVKRKK